MNFFSMNGTKSFPGSGEGHAFCSDTKAQQDSGLHAKLQVPIIDRGAATCWFGGHAGIPDAEMSKLADPQASRFMAQLHCRELGAKIWNGLGPRSGWLVFYLADTSPGECQVLYSENGLANTGQFQSELAAKAGNARWPIDLVSGPSIPPEVRNDIRFPPTINRGLVPGMRTISAPCSRPFDWQNLLALLHAVLGHLREAAEQSNRLLLSETQATLLRKKALSRWSSLERRLDLLRLDVCNAQAVGVLQWGAFAKRAEDLARNSLLYSADAFDKQISWLRDTGDETAKDKSTGRRYEKILAFLNDLEAKQSRYRAEQQLSENYEDAIHEISAAFSKTATVVEDIKREIKSRAAVELFSDAAVATVLQRLSELYVFGISSENGDWRVSGRKPVFDRHNLIDYLQPRLMRSYWPARLSSALYWYCLDPSILGAPATEALENDLGKYGGLMAGHIGQSQAEAPPKNADEINLLTLLPCEYLGWHFPKPLSFRIASRDLEQHNFSKVYLI